MFSATALHAKRQWTINRILALILALLLCAVNAVACLVPVLGMAAAFCLWGSANLAYSLIKDGHEYE